MEYEEIVEVKQRKCEKMMEVVGEVKGNKERESKGS